MWGGQLNNIWLFWFRCPN